MARAENASPFFTLDDYRRKYHIALCAFNGVENPDETLTNCDKLCWAQWEREAIAQALADAEGALAEHLRWWIGPRFFTDLDHVWTDPLILRWGHIVGGGVEGTTDVSADVSTSDFTIDPATITIPITSFPGGIDEVQVIETSSGLEIYPDDIAISGVNYVLSIDQCKLIEWDNLENQVDCIDYDNTFPGATWLKLADLTINRHYLDTTDQADIEYGPSCSCTFCGTACAGTSYTGCVYVIDEWISKVRVQMSTYDDATEVWSCQYPVLYGCYAGDKATVSYQAGTTDVPNWKEAICRLAHTYLDFKPCGCAYFDFALNRDRRIPSILTAERINCPLGQMDGAWYAWNWIQNHKNGRAFML
jgi:hypothetical protein